MFLAIGMCVAFANEVSDSGKLYGTYAYQIVDHKEERDLAMARIFIRAEDDTYRYTYMFRTLKQNDDLIQIKCNLLSPPPPKTKE